MAAEERPMTPVTGSAIELSKTAHVLTTVARRIAMRPRPKARRARLNSKPYLGGWGEAMYAQGKAVEGRWVGRGRSVEGQWKAMEGEWKIGGR